MKFRLLFCLILISNFLSALPANAQRQDCDNLWKKCELETVYCQRDVEDLGNKAMVSISRKIEEYYRDLPATFNACVRFERCSEWKEETCWLSKQLKKRREDY